MSRSRIKERPQQSFPQILKKKNSILLVKILEFLLEAASFGIPPNSLVFLSPSLSQPLRQLGTPNIYFFPTCSKNFRSPHWFLFPLVLPLSLLLFSLFFNLPVRAIFFHFCFVLMFSKVSCTYFLTNYRIITTWKSVYFLLTLTHLFVPIIFPSISSMYNKSKRVGDKQHPLPCLSAPFPPPPHSVFLSFLSFLKLLCLSWGRECVNEGKFLIPWSSTV